MPIEQVYEQIADFARERGAARVTLFGSRARGCAGPRNDIDLAVEGCLQFDLLEEDLQERLWSLLEVDVVNLDGPVSEALREDIIFTIPFARIMWVDTMNPSPRDVHGCASDVSRGNRPLDS